MNNLFSIKLFNFESRGCTIPMAQNWLQMLTNHLEHLRQQDKQQKLIVIFELEGPILDRDHELWIALSAAKGAPSDIQEIFDTINQATSELSDYSIIQSDVLSVIRWLQLQPDITVGIVTSLRASTVEKLVEMMNRLGETQLISFSEVLFYKAQEADGDGVPILSESTDYFKSLGYKVAAIIHSQADVLHSLAESPDSEAVLLMLYDTLTADQASRDAQAGIVTGASYDITELIPEYLLPPGVDLIWHGINDEPNLRQFLCSNIEWGECDIHFDPASGELVLHHDALPSQLQANHQWLTLTELMRRMKQHNRRVKLDLKQGGPVIEQSLELVDYYGFTDEQLWFNGNVEVIEESGFRKLAAVYPGAVLQCPVDWLAPVIESDPQEAHVVVSKYADWGMNRFSLNWHLPNLSRFLSYMKSWGLDVNIYGVYDLKTFLEAVMLLPRSVTCDFNFPKWHYYGRGSGEHGQYYEYDFKAREQ